MQIYAIHIINQSWVFDVIYKIFKPLLDSRMKARIYFHGTDMSSLHKHISPTGLPEMYGGVRPEHSYKQWLLGMRTNDTILKEVRSLGYVVEQEHIDKFMKDNGFDKINEINESISVC